MKFRYVTGACVLSILFVMTIDVWAHSGATGVVKERMDSMKEMKESMKSLSAMFKGEETYNPERVRDAANILIKTSGENITRLFPEGSLHKPSEAKSEIWSEWNQFNTLAERLNVYSSALSKAANGEYLSDEDGAATMMGAQDMMMGSTLNHMGEMNWTQEEAVTMGVDEVARMPVENVFKLVADTCSDCHTRYRLEKD